MLSKILRFFIPIFFVSIFTICFSQNSSAFSRSASPWDELSTLAEDEPIDVKEAAVKNAWPILYNEIVTNPEGYGFSGKEEADNIEIGPAFRLFEIDKSKVFDNDNRLFSEIITFDDEWLYILYTNGNPKCLMVITKVNGEYTLGRGCEPAGDIIKALNEFKNKVSEEQSEIKPIVVYDGNNYLLIGKDDFKEWVIPAYPTQAVGDTKDANDKVKILSSENALNAYRAKIIEIRDTIKNSKEDIIAAGREVLHDNTSNLYTLYYLIASAFAVGIALILFIKKRCKKMNL
jgi:hypothetical protein